MWVGILASPSVGGVGPEVEDVCEMSSPCEFNYCLLWWPWRILRLVTTNFTLQLLMWPIGKRSTLYSAEILALQEDKFNANISGCRFETKSFNHYSQTKNNTNRINYRDEKIQPKPNFLKNLFKKKTKGIYFWVLLIFQGKSPCLLTGLQAVFLCLIFCSCMGPVIDAGESHHIL